MSDDAPIEVEHVLGPYRLVVATAFGPRLTSLTLDGDGDLFAHLADSAVIHGPAGDFHLRGGHRLWAAPEVPDITYAPDDHPCEVSLSKDGLTVAAPPDAVGLAKRISVAVSGEDLVVDHQITNTGTRSMIVAPWAITQLGLGGTALLPLASDDGAGGLQADRSLILWPYTRLSDPRIRGLDHAVAISATAGPRLKLGSGPHPRRLGYLADGFLFLKAIEESDDPVPDRGAVGQVFVAGEFCELESVGRLTTLEAGASVAHRERWRLLPCPDLPAAIREVEA